MKNQIQKIIDVLKNETAYILIVASMGFSFFIGVLVEKGTTNDRILKMQFECYKRKVGDFYYTDDIGNMEFRWRKN